MPKKCFWLINCVTIILNVAGCQQKLPFEICCQFQVFASYRQPETPQTCCKLRILPAYYKLSTSYSRLVDVINLQQACWNQACCKLTVADLMQVDDTTCINLSLWMTTCSKPDRTTCSKSDERINADASWENQACCKLSFADLMQVVSSTCIKSADIKFWQVCSSQLAASLLHDNLQQTWYYQAGASDANASWYRLDDRKLHQVCSRPAATCAFLAV